MLAYFVVFAESLLRPWCDVGLQCEGVCVRLHILFLVFTVSGC